MSIVGEIKGSGTPPRFHSDECVPELSDRILDILPVATYLCDRDGVIVRYNRKASELWGRTPSPGDPAERFCGSYRMYRLDGGPLPHAECPMADVLRTGVALVDQEIVIERPDGSRAVALVNIDVLRDRDGIVIGAINCFRDFIEHRRSRAALREREQVSRELLQALPAAVYTTDAAGRITFYNEAAAALWGHRPEIGKSEWCGSWRMYQPDGRPLPHDECPMAVALKEGRDIKGEEAVAERPDGTRVPFLAYPTLLRDEAGVVTGAVNTLVDITEYKHGERAGRHLAAIVESSSDAIVGKNLDGIISSWNRGAERLFGYKAEEAIGQSIMIVIPEDRHDEEAGILEHIRRGEPVDHLDTVRRRKNGSLVEISLTVSPVRDARGRIVGASKIARDITERKRMQERQGLLLREMNHRAKNLYALAGAVVTLTARSAGTPAEMAQAVRERLNALASAHDLTLPDIADGGSNADRGTTLHTLLRTIASPYVDLDGTGGERITVRGPDMPIGGSAVTSLALLLHEFATNAAKYGALSSPTGHVEIDCSIEQGTFLLTWRERGGPSVDGEPGAEGFGSLLARTTVTGQFGGRISRNWEPEGLTVQLSVPVEALEERDPGDRQAG